MMSANAALKPTTNRPNHNIPDGPVRCCQVCGSEKLELVLDLGHQPLSDSLVSKEGLQQPETFYPLRQLWCRECSLNQLDYVVPGDLVYHQEYPYKTGVTKELVEYQKQMAQEICSELQIPAGSLVADVGSNDGTLLKGFKACGMEVQGIEPTNIAELANADGVPTLHAPFNQHIATQIVQKRGKAKVVTATNVFAHMQTLGDVVEGLEILVADDGYFCLENHYMTAIKDRLQYDTIYHEHLRSYSLHSLVKLFSYYDFTVMDARKVARYGGNIRVYVAKGAGRTPKPSVQEILDEEINLGLFTDAYYAEFREQCKNLKDDLLAKLIEIKRAGKTVVGNSCPARSSTLLNFAGIGPDLLPYIAEQPHSLKLNKYLPGTHIPIVNNQRLIDEQPDYVVLLAWHLAQPIAEQLRARGLKSKFIMPMPKVEILDI